MSSFPDAALQETAEAAAQLLAKKRGCVILAPTETVYGLLCAWDDSEARAAIYAMKQRPENKPFAAFVKTPAEAEKLCGCPLPEKAKQLAEKYMPGPLTLIVPDSKGGTFGFRIPDCRFIQNLLSAYGGALASTSANISGCPPALCAEDALAQLRKMPDFTADGGHLPADSLASTVVLVNSDNSVKILRQGALVID